MTTESKVSIKELSAMEKVAARIALAIIIAGSVFWAFQISGVMEMLEMAYG